MFCEGTCLGLSCACALQGRILVLETKPGQHKLHLIYEKETRGAVYTMSGFQVALDTVTCLLQSIVQTCSRLSWRLLLTYAQFFYALAPCFRLCHTRHDKKCWVGLKAKQGVGCMQGKLIAGINSRVQLYDWQLQKDSSRGLVAGAGQSGLVLALYLACRGDFIVVGQLLCPLLPCSQSHVLMLLLLEVAATSLCRVCQSHVARPWLAELFSFACCICIACCILCQQQNRDYASSCHLELFCMSASP